MLAHNFSEKAIKVTGNPAAVSKPASEIFFRAARSLHHGVKGRGTQPIFFNSYPAMLKGSPR